MLHFLFLICLLRMGKFKFSLQTFPNKMSLTPCFYIQSKGLHSGRPLRQPIKNCVAVYSDAPHLFDIVHLLYKGRKFDIHIGGSVVPFIRIGDIQTVIFEGIEKHKPEKDKYLKNTALIDEVIRNCNDKIKVLKSLQMAMCNEFLK